MNKYNSFSPGKVWMDTAGKPIQAHGFSVFYNEQEKLWYWYGENKEKTVGGKGNTVWHWGVRLYTSPDLYNWTDKGLIIPPQPDDLQSPLHPTYCMDRPHIIYCEKTGKYVAWLKIMAGEVSQFMSIMQADKFGGPYKFVNKIYKPLDMDTGDFALHADQDGKAYIWFERPHFQLICATLTDDYTAVTGEYSIHYDNMLPPLTREAPTYFERNGKRYLFTSGTSGYFPNPSKVCVFEDPHGEYTDLGDPFIGDKSNTSFSSQITSVIKISGTAQYIACADRWMPQWYIKPMAKQIISGMMRHFKDYKPDTSPQKAAPLPGELQKHGENTSISRYVWLPIEWEGDKPVIRWHNEWKVEDSK
ncbi:MAG: family 43 glycosylhydrolase [Lachnospiraceae bacterium]|nr:family 43 glycosylhydrolase [Lachnospiraceae bacterium]